ncbi:uncharacterized protein DNG_07101 [Cephalotrichum gorgonifer]|uniref:Uncharacterized protein n=1 Tax=Cephalotrichum gorgonifer TaxID=2041049 RepID=A0AAE8N0X7_9PEZI|nr:uncharacterized protein DNG_07101 [Cephalotrichum gorgonifer]
MDEDLPIALRRTRRTATIRPEPTPDALPTVQTPRRAKRRVRFSDPGPVRRGADLSTGLTPMVRRTSLGNPRRRTSTSTHRPGSGAGVTDSPVEELTFVPIRQVLSGRVQRRLRRNGLSEEMNTIEAERRQRERKAREEVEELKARLKEKDLEIYNLQNETVVIDSERIWDLEKQVADLREELAGRANHENSAACYDWTTVARDPFADEYTTVADGDFGDATMADIQCSTPSRAARASFPSPPLTSPAVPMTPSSRYDIAETPRPTPGPTPMAHAGVQTSFTFDSEKEGLEEEVASLQLEMAKLTSTLEGYASLVGRLNERLSPYAAEPDADASIPVSADEEVERRIGALFTDLSDRTAALLELTASLSGLGFAGDDAPSIVASLASGFRAARLELEYLSPGESTLPLSSRGAEVLDLLLERLRDLSKRAVEDEATIDEYHALEQSLRKQLSARVQVMDELRKELAGAQELAEERGKRVEELEVGVSRLRGAVDGYVRDMGELERLVQRQEAEAREKDEGIVEREGRIAGLEAGLGEKTTREEQLLAQVADLEARYAEGVALTEKLGAEVSSLEEARSAMNQRHGAALALRDARVAELRGEIDRLSGSLRAAHATIKTLRVDKERLEGRMVEERGRARGVMDGVKGELQRVLRMSEELFGEGEAARQADGEREDGEENSGKGTRPSGLLSGGLARRRSSRKRPDSGLGLLEEDEVDF